MKRSRYGAVLALAIAAFAPVIARAQAEGIWQGYDGEWLHVTQQLVALAEATPADKFGWRPAPNIELLGFFGASIWPQLQLLKNIAA